MSAMCDMYVNNRLTSQIVHKMQPLRINLLNYEHHLRFLTRILFGT